MTTERRARMARRRERNGTARSGTTRCGTSKLGTERAGAERPGLMATLKVIEHDSIECIVAISEEMKAGNRWVSLLKLTLSHTSQAGNAGATTINI